MSSAILALRIDLIVILYRNLHLNNTTVDALRCTVANQAMHAQP